MTTVNLKLPRSLMINLSHNSHPQDTLFPATLQKKKKKIYLNTIHLPPTHLSATISNPITPKDILKVIFLKKTLQNSIKFTYSNIYLCLFLTSNYSQVILPEQKEFCPL